MTGKITNKERALQLVRERGVVRPRDLREHGIAREELRRLRDKGVLVQHARGLYMAADTPLTEHHGLVQVACLVPDGVVCLLSALRFHDLTTQEPSEVWLALPSRGHEPALDYPPLQTVRMNAATYGAGVETHVLERVEVPVFGVAKTVADCFKYRSKIGLDVALEALREGWRERRFTMDDLWHYAEICRVAKVMRPYLEMVVVP